MHDGSRRLCASPTALATHAWSALALSIVPPLCSAAAAVVAPDWLPNLSEDQRQRFFEAWFTAAPAVALLPALAR